MIGYVLPKKFFSRKFKKCRFYIHSLTAAGPLLWTAPRPSFVTKVPSAFKMTRQGIPETSNFCFRLWARPDPCSIASQSWKWGKLGLLWMIVILLKASFQTYSMALFHVADHISRWTIGWYKHNFNSFTFNFLIILEEKW